MSVIKTDQAASQGYAAMAAHMREAGERTRELLEPFEPGLRMAFEGMGTGSKDEYRLGVEMLGSYVVARHWGRIEGLFRALDMGRHGLGGDTMQRALDGIFSNLVGGAVRVAKFASGDHTLYAASESNDEAYEKAWDDHLIEIHRHGNALVDTMTRSGSPMGSPDIESLKSLIGRGSIASAFYRNRPPDMSMLHKIVRGETGQINNIGAAFSMLLDLWGLSDKEEQEELANEMLNSLLNISEPFSYIKHGYHDPLEDTLAIVPMEDGREWDMIGETPMIMPAEGFGFSLRKIVRDTLKESAEAARANTGPERPEISVDWRQSSNRLIMSDLRDTGLFRAFAAGTPGRARIEGWAFGAGASIAFPYNSIAIAVPRMSIMR